jgi:general secretion pathway protein E/type IV pilus assembly protein PilB
MNLVNLLIQSGAMRESDLPKVQEALRDSPNRPLHSVLMEKGFAKEEDVLPLLAAQFGMEIIDLQKVAIDPETLRAMPAKLVHRRGLMPISRINGTLTVATGDPFDVYAIEELQTLTGLHVQSVLASPREIGRLIKTHFGVGGETVTAMVAERGEVELLEELDADDSELAKQASEASVVRLVNEILIEAATERASDIHIEPEETGLRIRYRIDGILQTQALPPEISRFQNAIISRIKIMARLNIAEKRLPQDGRIKMRVHQHEIDVRVSIIPMIHGEGIVMRLLDKTRMVFNLKNVGMREQTYKIFRKMIDRPHGIVLVTGPTGSGKSTTLYSALNEIKDDATKIITVEDPVEYQQPGISQIQVHSKIGLTFAASLRSILRHDPDVILIGEIRDKETSENAIQAHRHGSRAIFGVEHGRGRHGSAPGADDLPGLQDGIRAAARRYAARLSGHGRGEAAGAVVARQGVPQLPSDGPARANRHPRTAGQLGLSQGPDRTADQRQRHPHRGAQGGHDHPAAGRLAEGAGGGNDHRRSGAGDGGGFGVKNPKSEYRNPKQIQTRNKKKENEYRDVSDFGFW